MQFYTFMIEDGPFMFKLSFPYYIERSENSITNAYWRIVRIHFFMKTRYAQYAQYAHAFLY